MERIAASLSRWRLPFSALQRSRRTPPPTLTLSAAPAVASPIPATDIGEAEVRQAITLVSSGAAVRVVLCGIASARAAVSALTTTAADVGVNLEIEATEDGRVEVIVLRR